MSTLQAAALFLGSRILQGPLCSRHVHVDPLMPGVAFRSLCLGIVFEGDVPGQGAGWKLSCCISVVNQRRTILCSILCSCRWQPGQETKHWPSWNRRATGVMIEILDSFVAHRLCPVSKQKKRVFALRFLKREIIVVCSVLRYFIVSGGFLSPASISLVHPAETKDTFCTDTHRQRRRRGPRVCTNPDRIVHLMSTLSVPGSTVHWPSCPLVSALNGPHGLSSPSC